jgi:hypothetical protein
MAKNERSLRTLALNKEIREVFSFRIEYFSIKKEKFLIWGNFGKNPSKNETGFWGRALFWWRLLTLGCG